MVPLLRAANTAGWSFWPSLALVPLALAGVVSYVFLSQHLLHIFAKRMTTDKSLDIGDFVRLLAFIGWLATPIVALVLGLAASTWIR